MIGTRVMMTAAAASFPTNTFVHHKLRSTILQPRILHQRPSTHLYSSSPSSSPYPSPFLDQIEATIHNVFHAHENTFSSVSSNHCLESIHQLDPSQREAVGVANHLQNRLDALHRNGDCRRCWLQKAHCVCPSCPPLEGPGSNNGNVPKNVHINRLFLLMHHKEIGMAVDTAKFLLAAFPQSCRLVVGGIGPEYQSSMTELLEAVSLSSFPRCLVLFPSEDARTFADLQSNLLSREEEIHREKEEHEIDIDATGSITTLEPWDVVVIDGTWSQARKLHSKYIPGEEEGGPPRVCLSEEAVQILGGNGDGDSGGEGGGGAGRQLRRHPIKWREVSTLEATRLLLRDMSMTMEMERAPKNNGEDGAVKDGRECWDILAEYQRIGDSAARRQLGPPRMRVVP